MDVKRYIRLFIFIIFLSISNTINNSCLGGQSMVGAILGDIIGSIYEFDPIKTKDFELFSKLNEQTDDSYLTMAIFSALEKCNGNYKKLSAITAVELISWYTRYSNPMGSYGTLFEEWVIKSLQNYKISPSYNSYGNGSAMRVSPVAYFSNSLEQCIELSSKVTRITHNHIEGIKGAEATAVSIYLALGGKSKKEIKKHIQEHYYPLSQTIDEIRLGYYFDGSCQGSVPESIQAFLESETYEDAIRNVVSLGGDADTRAAITGAIAEAYYGIPLEMASRIYDYLDAYCKTVVNRMIGKRLQKSR